MFQLEDTGLKTDQPVLEVLRSKNPEACTLTAGSLEAYGGKPLAMVPVDITDMKLETVARLQSGSAGPGEVDSISLQHCLMRFGVTGIGLRQIVGGFGDWMANGQPPWAAYRALIFGRLIGIYNCPRVRLVGMGET